MPTTRKRVSHKLVTDLKQWQINFLRYGHPRLWPAGEKTTAMPYVRCQPGMLMFSETWPSLWPSVAKEITKLHREECGCDPWAAAEFKRIMGEVMHRD